MFNKIVLNNGLRIITVPVQGTEAVTILVLVGTGSRYEKKEINGISHFLEHLLFKGTKKRPTPISISEPLDAVGGIYNAFTGEEFMGYWIKVNARHLDLALDIISDIFLNSKLEAKEIEKEKGVISDEINMHFDHPSSYVQILWSRLLYGDQPAGWDIAGTKESIAKIKRENFLEYLKKQYVASNTIICLAGRISSKETIEKVKNYFSGIRLSVKNPQNKLKTIEKQTKPGCLLYKRETDQSHFCLGVRAYNLFHPDRYGQDLLAAILGEMGMMSSRLFVKIREELGMAYYISTSVSTYADTGYLVTQAGVANQKVEKAISAILEEYRKIKDEKVSPKELKKIKDHLIGKTSLSLETSDAQSSFYGFQEVLEKKILTPKQIYDKINKVTAEDIRRVAKDIFQPRKLNLALIGPFKDKAKFKKLLKI